MTIQSLVKQLTAKDKAQIKALEVRELDEEEQGHFVAFVDEADQSYDVHIHVKEQDVQQITCDCGNVNSLCIHQGAVLLQIAQKGLKIVPTQHLKKEKPKSKLSVSGILLQEQNKETLVHWLAEVFKKNKTLEQQFIVTFSQEKTDYTTAYVEDIMQQTFKAVAGKRKTLEGVKIKKILDTLTIAFEPVNDFITVNMDKPIAYELYLTILKTMYAFDRRIVHHSKKFDDFYQNQSTWFALTLANNQDQNLWKAQMKRLVESVFMNPGTSGNFEGLLMKNIYEHGSRKQQKELAHEMYEGLRKSSQTRYAYKMDFVSFIRDIALTHDFYEEVYSFFKIQE